MSKNEDPIHAETSRGHQPMYTGVQALPPRHIRVIGVPLDLGQSRRGVDMGPSAVRVAGLEAHLEALGHVVTDAGNIGVAIAETKKPGQESAKYLKEIRETCVKAADLVVKTLEEGSTPVILGGDHSVAAGSVSGVAEFYRRKGQKIGLIWIDAHSDINTPETSPSGNVHGMPMAALLGRLIAAQRTGSGSRAAAEVPLGYLARLQGAFGPGRPARDSVPSGIVDPLTSRELEVLQMLAAGKSNQAIAGQLVVTLDTVKKHVSHVLGKLGAANRTEAVTRARELGLTP